MSHMETIKKVTVHVPAHLLESAQEVTGSGITQTVTVGLEKIAAGAAYQKMLALRGSCRLNLNLEKLREDRDLV